MRAILETDSEALCDAYLDGGLVPPLCAAVRCGAPAAVFEELLRAGAYPWDTDLYETAAALVSARHHRVLRDVDDERWAIEVAEVLMRVGGLKPNGLADASGRSLQDAAEANDRKRLANFWRFGSEVPAGRCFWRAATTLSTGLPARLTSDVARRVLEHLLPEELLGPAAKELRRSELRGDFDGGVRLPRFIDFTDVVRGIVQNEHFCSKS